MVLYQVLPRLFGNQTVAKQPWGTIEENGVGKFNDFSEKALTEIKKMGFTHIWYTGVIEHALLTDYTDHGIPLDNANVVKGRAGSPYAIKDYFDVNPDLAVSVPDRMVEFEALVDRTHKAGMQVIIDFVPNHVARSYHSDAKPEGMTDLGMDDNPEVAFDPNNNFYYLPGEDFVVPAEYKEVLPDDLPTKHEVYSEHPAKATGNDVFSSTPSVNDWFETVKLNYGVDYVDGGTKHFEPIPDTWQKMKNILLYWAAKGIDGFRCDMAEMVPVEFWKWVIREVKREYPALTFTAEIYNPHNYRNYIFIGGFDYLYDKVELYDTLKQIIRGHGSTDQLTQVWQSQEGITDNMLRFLENHDEQRIASPDFAGDMHKGIPMMAISAFMHRGPIKTYFGQELGEAAEGDTGFSGDDGRTTIFDYWSVPEHQKWMNDGAFDGGGLSDEQRSLRSTYTAILTACNNRPALREGHFFDLHYYNRNEQFTGYSDRIFAFIRHMKIEALLVVVNLGGHEEETLIKIPEHAWQTIGLLSNRILVEGDKKTTEVDRLSAMDYGNQSSLKVRVPGYDYVILQLKTKT